METPLPTCAPDDKVRQIMQIMTEKRARHLVVRADDETLGLISIGDVVKYHIRDTELENKVLRDMATARLAS
jgi:predicted transcriptional regulator